MGYRSWAMGVVWATASLAASAQTDPTIFNEQQGLVRAGQKVSAYGSDLFGDQVNLYTGTLSFTQTDVSLPGNFALPVGVTRTFAAGSIGPLLRFFGDWDLDLPSISGVFAVGSTKNKGWAVPVPATSPNLYKRCTYFGEPNLAFPNKGTMAWESYEYWQGTHLNAPGGGEILHRSTGNTAQPTDGNAWPLVTRGGWQIRCLPSLHASNLGDTVFHQGEGFVAVSPEGTQYRFDWLVTRDVMSLVKWHSGGSLDRLFRAQFTLYPTQITDRHGNTVNLNFDPANQRRLNSITASDGRGISFSYDSSDRITSASDGTRTWTYAYLATGGRLSSVGLPDGSAWQINMGTLANDTITYAVSPYCSPGTVHELPITGSITHPSGATGTFTVKSVVHGRKVSSSCIPGTNGGWEFVPKNFATRSIVSKTIAGPGMANANWSFAYNSPPGSDPSCSTCPSTKTVEVTDPRGARTRHTYGIHVLVNEGQLLQVDEGWNGSSAARTTVYTYRDKAAGPYPAPVGWTQNLRNASLADLYHSPQNSRTTTVQGVNFVWSASAFDMHARPTSIGRASSLGYSRGETIEYFDHLGKWVLGQTSRVIVPGYTYPAEQHTYNLATANREASYSFGRLLHTSGYNADGTLAWRADPAGRSTGYANYHRGLARLITYPDGATESAVVDNRGLVTAHTNPAGTTTNYGYDTIGRLTSITYPGETNPSLAYHPTTLAFERVAGAEYGIAGGHWRQTVATGNARTVRYFDALWRERLSRTYDAANEAGTRSVVERRYDADGRLTFESYPQRDIASVDGSVPGTTNVYDGLGRISQSMQSSELGNLVTTTEYLGGFQRRTTNPRGHATTQGFQVFDNPVEANLAWVSAPAGVSVSFTRDVLGKASAITRSGGGVAATRSYVYDVHQRLCKSIEPESGATVQDYDSAGNLAWRASGNALPSTSACDQASVSAARKISYGYDTRNRLISTTFGDGSPGIGRSYTADSLPSQVWSNGTTWTYGYNHRRLLTSETLNYAGVDYTFGHGYESHGHRSSLSYSASMGGSVVSYAPNALGQPTQAGAWATNATYHPDGSPAGFRLANGSWFSMSQNTRGLPANWRYTGVLNDTYTYDAHGNVSSITDTQEGGATSRSMGYDALDRLTAANGPWGTGSYTYDSLDNLRTSVVGPRSLTHNYDANTNRLASLTGTTAIGFVYDANGNVTQRAGQLFSFDIGNRLASAAGKASYVYDGHGRRVRTNPVSGSPVTYAYTSDGLPRWDSASGARIYLGNRLIAELGGGGYFHTDALGSVVARTGGAAEVLARTRYEPYGATASGSAPLRIGFTGHVNDADTGLVQMQQRYYEPLAGRFLSVDPVTTDHATGGSFGRFHYAENNPYKFRDPDGRAAETPWDAANVALGAISLARNLATGNYVGAAVDAIGIVADGVATAIPGVPGGAAAGIQAYRAAGVAREAVVAKKLADANPGAKVQGQRLLRDAEGKKAVDPVTGEGRVVDHAVIQDGKAVTYETTSMTADKGAQMAKEQRILDAGGNYVRDKETKAIVPVAGRSEIIREN